MRLEACLSLSVLLLVAAPAFAADAPGQLAGDLGCYNCHGEPPRKGVPSFPELVTRYAEYRGRLDADAEHRLVDRMRNGSLFSHVAAHQRISEEQARTLVRWLVEGGG